MPQREGNTAAALPSMLPSAFVMNYEHSTLHVEHCTLTSRRGQLDYTARRCELEKETALVAAGDRSTILHALQ
jgi:hypothetical protein